MFFFSFYRRHYLEVKSFPRSHPCLKVSIINIKAYSTTTTDHINLSKRRAASNVKILKNSNKRKSETLPPRV